MTDKRVPYQPSDLELVKTKLSGILSQPVGDISQLVRKKYPDDIVPLADIFLSIASSLHHKWASTLLALVPAEAWQLNAVGEEHIVPDDSASLRYLSTSDVSAESKEQQQVEQRKALFAQLTERMSPLQLKYYRPMLHWVDVSTLNDAHHARHGFSSDTAFGMNLYILEGMMDALVLDGEMRWARQHQWPESESIPAEITRACSRTARDKLCEIIEQWCGDGEQASPVPESLLALTSANLSVNRALLEFAAMDARGKEAAGMTVPFLRALNQQGIVELPHIMDDISLDDAVALLRKLLSSWFGHGGSVLQDSAFFRRPMNESDVEIILTWSRHLQEEYIRGRGHRGGPDKAREYHGSSNNLFIFAMTLVAAFYSNTRTKYEFMTHSNSTYAVFPDRGEVVKGKREAPPTHAAQILQQAYGQMFFANSSWNLQAEKVQRHAETSSIKRAHIEQLLRFAVKGRSSSQLLCLFNRLQAMKEKHQQLAKCPPQNNAQAAHL